MNETQEMRLKRLGVPAAEVKRRSAKAKATRNKTAGKRQKVLPDETDRRVIRGATKR